MLLSALHDWSSFSSTLVRGLSSTLVRGLWITRDPLCLDVLLEVHTLRDVFLALLVHVTELLLVAFA